MAWNFLKKLFTKETPVEILAAFISGQLYDVPEIRINAWMARVGKAFGPAGIRHFSELSHDEQQALLRRVPVLKTRHEDWPKPLSWVPRRWTCYVGPAPTMTDVIDGNVTEMRPIPKNGEWYVIRGYMASTTQEGIHNRVGFRYDDVDDYWEFPAFTVKVF